MSADAKDFARRYGPWALVAGASEGMGHQYALQLAERGLNVVMVARNPDRLHDAAAQVFAHGVTVREVAADLADENIVDKLRPEIAGLEIGLLVYNAGISTQHDFFEADVEEHLLPEIRNRCARPTRHQC